MGANTQPTVKIKQARPADWAVAKAARMHAELAHAVDKKAARAAERQAARAQRKAERDAA